MNPEWFGPAVRQNRRMGWAGVAERKGTGTLIRATQQPCRHGPGQQPLRLARGAKESSRGTIAVGGRGMMNLWL